MAKETWDLLLIEERPDPRDRCKTQTVFHQVCPLWRGDGGEITGSLPFALERGDRICLKPRESRGK